MNRTLRHVAPIALVAGTVLCSGSPAAAAPGAPGDIRPTTDFVRAAPCTSPSAFVCILLSNSIPLQWTVAQFTPGSISRRYLLDPEDDGFPPLPGVIVDDQAATGATLNVQNGHLYHVDVYATEELPGGSSPLVLLSFRVDETSPTAAITIAGGATFTRTREVSIDVPADDPPTAGSFPASGVGGLATWSGPASPLDQIAGAYRQASTITLPEGPDGARTVNAVVFDRAQHPLSRPVVPPRLVIDPRIRDVFRPPRVIDGPVVFPTVPIRPFPFPVTLPQTGGGQIIAAADAHLAALVIDRGPARVITRTDLFPPDLTPPPPVGAASNGNPSATASDQIILDTTPPLAAVTVTPASSPAGVPVALSAVASSDATSGIDPAATIWRFGDSTTATGMSVEHAYASPDTYAGSVSLTDRAGNVTVGHFTVKVSAKVTTDGGTATTPTGGARVTGVTPALRVRTSIGGGLAGARARLDATWRESALVGKIVLGGRSLRPLSLIADLHPRSAGLGPSRRLNGALRLHKGPVARDLRLPPGLLPGSYDLEIRSASGPTLQRVLSLRIPAPREGVAASAVAALTPTGTAIATAPRGAKHLFARFRLAALPATGQRLAVTWYSPDAQAVGTALKARRARIVSFVRSSAALPSGRWRAVLRAGTARVAEVVVRVP